MSSHRRALLATREIISTSQRRYICFALADVAHADPSTHDAAYELRDLVMAELSPHCGMLTYLMAHHMPFDPETLLQARLAWLDKLLEGYP